MAGLGPLVSFRRCDKVAGNVALRYDYQGMPSCAAAAGLVGGSDSCSYSCLGFGDCVQVCPFDAIEVRGGLARVNASKCTGCGKCAETCPRNVLELVPARARVMVFCSTKDRLKARDGSLQGRLHQVRALRQELSRRCRSRWRTTASTSIIRSV